MELTRQPTSSFSGAMFATDMDKVGKISEIGME
jgi:hypothetical protein